LNELDDAGGKIRAMCGAMLVTKRPDAGLIEAKANKEHVELPW
jgi:hypothetical protein